ncbi:HYC_CC_PP family protein [Flavobacterium sp.]|uniref:HYC_CC_PP family protein n=1 Tax=Flavobacterium sp. TaxID=239 RepID=UPI003A91C769
MKKIVHKILALIMVLVVLFSTLSFTVNMHYCGDTLVETTLFHEVKGCGMNMEKPLTENCSITKKNCCENEQLVQNGQDELQLNVDKISFQQQIFLVSFVYTYISLFESVDKKVSLFKAYKPPLVVRQIFKIDETYLI